MCFPVFDESIGQLEKTPGTFSEFRNFSVTFPMFAKIDVNGMNAHPLYQYLKSEKPGILGTEAIKWNFTKFLVGSDGTVPETLCAGR